MKQKRLARKQSSRCQGEAVSRAVRHDVLFEAGPQSAVFTLLERAITTHTHAVFSLLFVFMGIEEG